MERVVKKLSYLKCMFPAEVKQGDLMSSCFSSHSVNKCVLFVICLAMFFPFLCFLLTISVFMLATKHCAVCSAIPKRKKAVMYLTDKIHVLDKLQSGMNYSADDHDIIIKLYLSRKTCKHSYVLIN